MGGSTEWACNMDGWVTKWVGHWDAQVTVMGRSPGWVGYQDGRITRKWVGNWEMGESLGNEWFTMNGRLCGSAVTSVNFRSNAGYPS